MLWPYRREGATPLLIALIFILILWGISLTQELSATDLHVKTFWVNAQLPLISALPFLWFRILCRTLDARPTRSWWQVAGWGITAALCLLAILNPRCIFAGSLALVPFGDKILLGHNYGPLFWFGLLPWSTLLFVCDIAILARGMSQLQVFFRSRNQILLIASLLPTAGMALHFNALSSQLYLDTAFTSVVLLALLGTYAALRYRLFSLIPFPRATVIEHLSDGIIVLDAKNRMVDYNDAAKAISSSVNEQAIGQTIEEILSEYPVVSVAVKRNAAKQEGEEPCPPESTEELALDRGMGDKVIEVHLEGKSEQKKRRYYSTSITTLTDRNGGFAGSVAIFHEITHQMELYRIAQRNAATDELTGFLVRRQFNYVAHRVLLRAIREQKPVSILVVDIDHFKTINDTYGHHAGDLVLREAASLCRDHLRPLDVCARIGGDELCVLLPQVDAPLAVKIADRLRKALAAQRHTVDEHSFHITVSIGVADRAISGSDRISDLVKAADEGLYRAKREGRDRVATGSSLNAP